MGHEPDTGRSGTEPRRALVLADGSPRRGAGGAVPVVNGVCRLDDFLDFLQQPGVIDLMDNVQGTAVQRERVLCVQYVLLYSLKTLFGIERRHALAALLCSDEALMRLVGYHAHQARHRVCQRGVAPR